MNSNPVNDEIRDLAEAIVAWSDETETVSLGFVTMILVAVFTVVPLTAIGIFYAVQFLLTRQVQ